MKARGLPVHALAGKRIYRRSQQELTKPCSILTRPTT